MSTCPDPARSPSPIDALVQWRSDRCLARLHDELGAPGLAAAATLPGLSAAVDQHAAAVRDILRWGVDGSGRAGSAVLLAGYARGLLARAGTDTRAMGERVGTRWEDADWLVLRLLAVCALAAGTLFSTFPELDGVA
ncbi:DUF6401 family natural product biosynthesis protein [Pseudonocardia nigra]|uniref:DUF6401 family natural product biosynthesis protein n=1 Tax=Pseudonocardia nigra TaxID=1921578 RepID=UPI001C603623|nr:DUF6401 family natural product biosynthesis protein [Pseudonocardia nigra]